MPVPADLKRVFVCSPLRARESNVLGTVTPQENEAIARELCRRAIHMGVAPFAPHAFYTTFLDDRIVIEREQGMRAGAQFLLACEEIWVFEFFGVSLGMQAEIQLARDHGIAVDYPMRDPRGTPWSNFDVYRFIKNLRGVMP